MNRLMFLVVVFPLFCQAVEPISIGEMVSNVDRTGFIPLDQGYRGKISSIEGSYLVDERDQSRFEFIHARLNGLKQADFLPA